MRTLDCTLERTGILSIARSTGRTSPGTGSRGRHMKEERKLAQGAARVLRGRLALRPNEVSPRARLRTAVRSARARLGADSIRAVLTSAVVP